MSRGDVPRRGPTDARRRSIPAARALGRGPSGQGTVRDRMPGPVPPDRRGGAGRRDSGDRARHDRARGGDPVQRRGPQAGGVAVSAPRRDRRSKRHPGAAAHRRRATPRRGDSPRRGLRLQGVLRRASRARPSWASRRRGGEEAYAVVQTALEAAIGAVRGGARSGSRPRGGLGVGAGARGDPSPLGRDVGHGIGLERREAPALDNSERDRWRRARCCASKRRSYELGKGWSERPRHGAGHDRRRTRAEPLASRPGRSRLRSPHSGGGAGHGGMSMTDEERRIRSYLEAQAAKLSPTELIGQGGSRHGRSPRRAARGARPAGSASSPPRASGAPAR